MKLNEIEKTNEGFLDTLGRALMGKPNQAKMTQDIFINDFVDDAMASLSSAIAGGLVSADAGPAPGETPVEPPKEEPPAPAPSPTPAPPVKTPHDSSAAVGAYKQQQQTTQNINNYVKNVAATLNKETDPKQKIALTKELINFMADRKGYPEYDNAMATAKQILAKHRAGGNMLRALQSGQKVTEAWNIYWINKLLEAVNLTWKDLGYTLLIENKTKKYKIVETKYYKLNKVFESIVEAAPGSAMSITDYLKKSWYPKYMKGVNYAHAQSQVDAIIDQIQQSYAKDQGKAALTKLANLSFSVSKGIVPAGAADAAPGGGGAPAPAPAPGGGAPAPAGGGEGKKNSHQMAEVAKNMLEKLKATDPAVYAQLIKELTTGKSGIGISESKKLKNTKGKTLNKR